MSIKRISALCVVLLLVSGSLALAQPDKPWKSWTGNVAIGYSMTQGDASDFFDNGWNFTGGATYKPETWPVGVFVEGAFNRFDAKNNLTEALGVGSGDMDIFSITGGGIWSTKTQGRVDFYVSAGAGWYRRSIELRNPTTAYFPPTCNPWWYWCTPGGLIPAEEIVGSDTQNKVGANGGIGLTFALANDSQIYLEVKYHWMDTKEEATTWVPVTVGYRW